MTTTTTTLTATHVSPSVEVHKQQFRQRLEMLDHKFSAFIEIIGIDLTTRSVEAFRGRVVELISFASGRIDPITTEAGCDAKRSLFEEDDLEQLALIVLKKHLLPEMMNMLVQPVSFNYSFEMQEAGNWHLRIIKNGVVVKCFDIVLKNNIHFVATQIDSQDSQEALISERIINKSIGSFSTCFFEMMNFIYEVADLADSNKSSSSSSKVFPEDIQSTPEAMRQCLLKSCSDVIVDTFSEVMYYNFQDIVKRKIAHLADIKFFDLIYLDQASINYCVEELHTRLQESVPCYVCDTLEEVAQAMQLLKESHFQGKIAFIARANNYLENPDDADYHNVPLLIEITQEATRIAILDSVPGSSVPYTENVYKQIQGIGFANLSVYIPNVHRQHNGRDCIFFTLNDIEMFFKVEDFFSYLLAANTHMQVPGRPEMFWIFHLPPELMGDIQSMGQLNSYLNSSIPASSWPDAFKALKARKDKRIGICTKVVNEDRRKTLMENPKEFEKILTDQTMVNLNIQNLRAEYIYALSERLLLAASAEELTYLATAHSVASLGQALLAPAEALAS